MAYLHGESWRKSPGFRRLRSLRSFPAGVTRDSVRYRSGDYREPPLDCTRDSQAFPDCFRACPLTIHTGVACIRRDRRGVRLDCPPTCGPTWMG